MYYKVRRSGGDYQWSRHYTAQDMELRKRVIKSRTIVVRSENFSKKTQIHSWQNEVFIMLKQRGVGESFYLPVERCSLLM